MKRLLLSIIAICSFLTANAQHEKGFRAFADVEYVLSCTEVQVGRYKSDLSSRIGAQFTAGYQTTDKLFVGAGIGYQNFYDGKAYALPIYADARYDILSNKNTPFIDAKVGYSVGDMEGLYINPSVGYRIGLGDKLGLNVSVGYLIQTLKDVDGTTGDITFKVGVDF